MSAPVDVSFFPREAKPLTSYRKFWAQRFGTAEEFGDTCAFLCSQQASYITGQNVLIDGGAYPGTY